MNLFELKKRRAEVSAKIEGIMLNSAKESRAISDSELKDLSVHRYELAELNDAIKPIESRNTLSRHAAANGGMIIPGDPDRPSSREGGRQHMAPAKRQLSSAYAEEFFRYFASRGAQVGEHLAEGLDTVGGGYKIPGVQAASYEGGATTGTPITPLTVEQYPVELAPAESGVIKLASVLPTIMDQKIPRKTAFGSVALKAESGSSANLFTDSDATLDSFTLSAFMIGGSHTFSWELVQDVPSFMQFGINDLLMAQQVYEDNLYVNGNGTGQPQGLLGHVGTGVTGVAAGTDTYASELLDATYDVQSKLNAVYWPGAAWLMSRETGLAIRKAQRKANLFDPIWTREGGVDKLHGFPVEFSAAMPSIASGHTPVLFGNFQLGYVIGLRGGAGINVKILDQPLATAGQIICLVYRRVDGRVRRSEAIQPIVLA